MKIYSPSSTTTFARCPQMWEFYRKGWQPKHVGHVEAAAAAGVGFAKGMEVLFSGGARFNSDADIVDKAVSAAQHEGSYYLQKRIDSGGIVSGNLDAPGKLSGRLDKAIRKFATIGGPRFATMGWHTFMPELSFPDHGNARADLLCQSDMGPCIVDFKTKVTRPQPYYLSSFISAFEYSWQFYHYIWAAREMGIDVGSFAVCVVSFEPFQIDIEQWVVDESYLSEWYASAEQWWQRMENAEESGDYAMAPNHTDQYGLCRYSDTCFSDNRGRNRWDHTMIHVPRDLEYPNPTN